jgi:hypothetical protein
MRFQAFSENIAIHHGAHVPSVLPKIEAGIRFLRPRLLEVVVGGLLIFWWLNVFGLWVTALQWAASLGTTPSP